MDPPPPNPFLSLPPIPTFPDLHGKVVLITGIGQVGSSISLWGNGAATACAFALQGCKVFGCDLDVKRAEETGERVRVEVRRRRGEQGKAGGEGGGGEGGEGEVVIEVVKCDVTDERAVEEMVRGCIERFGGVDVLVKYVFSLFFVSWSFVQHISEIVPLMVCV
jgi:NAD(P)-dependent dehydrogenase (short-subunit alcohol dehydrogenase family)